MANELTSHCGLAGDGEASDQCKVVRALYREIVAGKFPGLEEVVSLMLLCYIAPLRSDGDVKKKEWRGDARRHVLLEGAQGSAKSEITKEFARQVLRSDTSKARYKASARVQGTPDILPSAFVGYESRKKKAGSASTLFSYSDGPLLERTCVFHVDEINRIPSRVLSVLFEAMAEGEVSLTSLLAVRRSRSLPWLFVVGTQNPGTFIGTNPLPEPLLDRFMVRYFMPYLDKNDMNEVLSLPSSDNGANGGGNNVLSTDFDDIRRATGGLTVRDSLLETISELLIASWPRDAARALPNLERQLRTDPTLRRLVDENLTYGLGVRAGQALRDLACSVAWCREGGYEAVATIDDVRMIAGHVLGHRFRFRPGKCVTPQEQAVFVRAFMDVALRDKL